MHNSLRIAVAGALVLSFGSVALAEGHAKTERGVSAKHGLTVNARMPAGSALSPATRAQTHGALEGQIGETKPGEPNTVYWRGRNVGTDPDPVIRTQLLRNAISGGG